jgi:16S rRNA processing protein RimM
VRGEVYIQLYAEKADWREGKTELHFARPESSELKIYKIQSLKPHKIGLIAKLEGVNDRDLAFTMRGLLLAVPEEWLRAEDGEGIYLQQILGFTVVDDRGEIGKVTGFSSNGPQDLLEVQATSSDEEYLIPFVENFILGIDFDKRMIQMDLPEGLINSEEE